MVFHVLFYLLIFRRLLDLFKRADVHKSGTHISVCTCIIQVYVPDRSLLPINCTLFYSLIYYLRPSLSSLVLHHEVLKWLPMSAEVLSDFKHFDNRFRCRFSDALFSCLGRQTDRQTGTDTTEHIKQAATVLYRAVTLMCVYEYSWILRVTLVFLPLFIYIFLVRFINIWRDFVLKIADSVRTEIKIHSISNNYSS